MRKAGGDKPVDYLKLEMNTVMVSSYNTGGANDGLDRVQETLTFNFKKFKVTYTQQNEQGGKAAVRYRLGHRGKRRPLIADLRVPCRQPRPGPAPAGSRPGPRGGLQRGPSCRSRPPAPGRRARPSLRRTVMRRQGQAGRGAAQHQAQRLQVPLLYAFREAAEARDSRKPDMHYDEDGARVVSQRTGQRQRGTNESMLKRNLNIDLEHLANTINLASVIDLDDYPAIRRSVLNFGIDDLTHLTTDSSDLLMLGEALRAALIAHEPRLVPETLSVEQHSDEWRTAQRISFFAHAEMKCRPVDIPLEFVAEIDVGSGKVELHGVSGPGARRSGAAPG